MAVDEQKIETPASFLKEVGEKLQSSAGIDTELGKILSANILTAQPQADAVQRAKAAVIALAESRAKPAEGANA